MIGQGRYERVSKQVWDDDDFLSLDHATKLLWLYLLTGPETLSLPGLHRFRVSHAAELIGCDMSDIRKGLSTLHQLGMAQYDESKRLVWLPNAPKHRPPMNRKHAIGWLNAFTQIPDCAFKAMAAINFAKAVEQWGEDIADEFVKYAQDWKKRAEVVPNPENSSPDTVSIRYRNDIDSVPINTDTDTDTDTDTNTDTDAFLGGTSYLLSQSPRRKRRPTDWGPDKVMKVWNELTSPPIRAVKAMSDKRAVVARARILEPGFIDAWSEVCKRINNSPFCRGTNERGWTAGIDFALRPGVWNRVIEGEFDDRKGRVKQTTQQTNDSRLDKLAIGLKKAQAWGNKELVRTYEQQITDLKKRQEGR